MFEREELNLRSVDVTVSMRQLLTGDQDDDLALALLVAVQNVVSTERLLTAQGKAIASIVDRVTGPLDPTATCLRIVNSLGELQGSAAHFDTLCATLDAQRTALAALGRLYTARAGV
jgi:hypothetical protein